ncbi:MAG: aspartate 1-decarboxylase [Leptospira sp.]|nr:aspartate 1-decarboxylase [Leptospira sp.]NCS95284.1 aspartate 1-decarboxylase [Leptospira sp.]
MFITICKGKIHRATVTEADLNYEGSLTIDMDLVDAAGMIPYEKVQVVNVNNGSRFETYIIAGKRGSGTICLNGACARLGMKGDKVIIITYAQLEAAQVPKAYEPKVVHVDDHNVMKK